MGKDAPRALITGCSTGIGRATAVELAERGYEVVATARRVETLDDLDVAARLTLDVDDDDSVRAAVAAAGRVDVLVNNAGWGVGGAVESVPVGAVHDMFETNVLGAMRMIQAVLPGMRDRATGTIVNVSSAAGRIVTPLSGPYAASKHALEALSDALRFELRPFGVTVAVIQPGSVATAWSQNERWLGTDHDAYRRLYQQVMEHSDEQDATALAPELVAERISEAIEGAASQFRWPVGPDAELGLAIRDDVDDAEWERIVREHSPVDW